MVQDEMGNKWFSIDVAQNWSIGSAVVARRKSRELGTYRYFLFEKWQGGRQSFDESDMFLMLPRETEELK